jgi:HD-GYP domain-containing protein (c-di-GMP phosphodiesterase class II)
MTTSIIYAVFLFFGLFSLVGAGLLFIQFKNHQKPYITSWIIGTLLISVATFLVVLRNFVPDFVSYKIGNGLSIASYIYFYYSCVSLLGKKIALGSIALKAFFASTIFMFALILVANSFGVGYQPAVVAFFGSVFNFFTGLLLIKFYRQSQINLAVALAVILFLTALTWGIRCLMVLFADVGFAFQGGQSNLLPFLLLLVFGIAKYLSFSGLVISIEWGMREQLISQVHSMKIDIANKDVELANRKVKQTEVQLLTSLTALAKARDNETGNHIIRTQHYVNLLARKLRSEGHYIEQLSDMSIDALVRATPLHDIGKIGISDSILLKNTALTDDEWTVMKAHTSIGESVLGAAFIEGDNGSDVIAKAIKLAGAHHEKWDGSGYPRGLLGQDIPLEARIMSLGDMYDALVSERPYKKAWTHEQAMQEIISKRGTHFDPVIVDCFVSEQDSFREISVTYRD